MLVELGDPPFPRLEVQRSLPYVTPALIQCVLMSVLFCHTVNTDAVMANWGHVSPVTAVEVVPSSVGGCKLESSLLTSEEGAELKAGGSMLRSDTIVYHPSVLLDFVCSEFISGFIVVVSPNPESSGLSFQLATLDETGVLNFWVSWATDCRVYMSK